MAVFPDNLVLSGREFTEQELGEIADTVELCSGLSRTELAETVCEHLSWFSPSGRSKTESCLKALEKLEKMGKLELPRKRVCGGQKGDRAVSTGSRTEAEGVLSCKLAKLFPVKLMMVKTKEERDLWNEYIQRYHYLSYKRPFGAHLRYFVVSVKTERLLGCLLFSASAWALEVRDCWIGWSTRQKAQMLTHVVNNSRYLIFPWVRVKNLASHTLSLAAKQLRQDWQEYYGHQPVLLETFVDPRYRGTCYKAANWQYLGMTTGRGRMSRNKEDFLSSPKELYVYPLVKNFRSSLLGS